eukprot:357628-Chlamydomonas_euryale.AAC.1
MHVVCAVHLKAAAIAGVGPLPRPSTKWAVQETRSTAGVQQEWQRPQPTINGPTLQNKDNGMQHGGVVFQNAHYDKRFHCAPNEVGPSQRAARITHRTCWHWQQGRPRNKGKGRCGQLVPGPTA